MNLATFGITSLLFIPLTPDSSFSTDDSENVLGYWIGLDVSTEIIITPDERTIFILTDNRTLEVDYENRSIII